MCGRFALKSSATELAAQFACGPVGDLTPRYNIAPSCSVLAIRLNPSGMCVPVSLRWGLIPPWSRDPGIGARLINARAETAAEKPAFRAAFQRRRCLVPADAFYEWRQTGSGKQPYCIRLRTGGPFAIASLWEYWQAPQGGVVETCTLLTTRANSCMRPIHERMPVIIGPADYTLWLDPEVQETDTLRPLLEPFAALDMEAYPVSRKVNHPANNDASCLEPVEPDPLIY